MYEKERLYLKWKYLYYNGHTEVSDVTFDELEDELRQMGSKIVEIKDSPSLEILTQYNLLDELTVGEREIRFVHENPMLSLRKFQVKMDGEIEVFPEDISNFFDKIVGEEVDCSPKFDGNSMELTYINGILIKALTRGNEYGGLDRTENMKLIVPNTIYSYGYDKIIIRGEVIIPTELWSEKYSNPDKVDNPRNWLAGILNSDEVQPDIMKDVNFVAYHIILNDGKNVTKPSNQLGMLESLGFEKVYSLKTTSVSDFFKNVYPKFKDYRATCKYALDGIVLSFSAKYWDQLGVTNHHPHWACAVKFPPNRAITYLENIIWNIGKDGEYTPIGVFKPVELDGTVVKHASLHNLGWIIDNKVFPGCKVEIAKKGEIIPQIVSVLEESPDNQRYMDYINEYLNNHK